jgi:hypothetical protein
VIHTEPRTSLHPHSRHMSTMPVLSEPQAVHGHMVHLGLLCHVLEAPSHCLGVTTSPRQPVEGVPSIPRMHLCLLRSVLMPCIFTTTFLSLLWTPGIKETLDEWIDAQTDGRMDASPANLQSNYTHTHKHTHTQLSCHLQPKLISFLNIQLQVWLFLGSVNSILAYTV